MSLKYVCNTVGQFYEVSEVNSFQQRKKRKHMRLDFCCSYCYMLFISSKKNGLHFINTLIGINPLSDGTVKQGGTTQYEGKHNHPRCLFGR